MEENETVHPDYQRGFNEGYKLSTLAPEMADILSKAEGNGERMKGFKDGRNQFLLEKEKSKEFLPDWLKEPLLPQSDKDKTKGKEIDKE